MKNILKIIVQNEVYSPGGFCFFINEFLLLEKVFLPEDILFFHLFLFVFYYARL